MADTPRIDELKRRVESDPASIAFAALAEEYRRSARFDDAIALCTTGLQRHPSYLSAHVTLGRALIEVGRFDDAREELQFVLKLAPENLAAIRGLAEIHTRTRDADAVKGHYAVADTAEHGVAVTESTATGDEARSQRADVAVLATPAAVPETAVPMERSAPAALVALERFLGSIMRARPADATLR